MSTARFLIVFASLAATACGACAASMSHPPASQPVGRLYATRDQLRDCMDLEDALKARRKTLDAVSDAHEAQLTAIQAEDAKIVDVQGRLDHESETAITAFNLLVADHNAHVKEFNKEADDMRASSDAYNADALALNRKCSKMAYSVDDMNAVMKERRAAGK